MAAPTPEGEAARQRAALWIELYLDLSGLSAKQFAAEVDVSQSHISEMRSGSGSPGFETLLKLRRTMLFSIDDMFDRDPDERDRTEIKKRLSGMRARSIAVDENPPARRRRAVSGS